MRDILLRIPLPFLDRSFAIHTYGFMAMLGFLAALLVGRWRAKRVGMSPDTMTDLCIGALVGGIVGARIFFIAQNTAYYFGPGASFLDLFKVWEGGLVFYGGLFGATATLIAVARLKKERLLNVLDVIAPSFCLGLAFGRIGCFCHGCCFGIPVRAGAWYGVVFPPDSQPYLDAGARAIAPGTPLVPVQLLLSAGLFAIFAILSVVFRRRPWEGWVSALTLVLYSIHRFGWEFLRADTHAPGRFSIAQWISFGIFFAGLALFIWGSGHGRRIASAAPPGPARTTHNRSDRSGGSRTQGEHRHDAT